MAIRNDILKQNKVNDDLENLKFPDASNNSQSSSLNIDLGENNNDSLYNSFDPFEDDHRLTFGEFNPEILKQPKVIAELIALGSDLFAAGSSFFPGGQGPAALADLGGGVASAYVAYEDGDGWGALSALAQSLFSSGITLLGGPLSNVARFNKITRTIRNSNLITLLMQGLSAYGMKELGKSVYHAYRHARGEKWVSQINPETNEETGGSWVKDEDIQLGTDDLKAIINAISAVTKRVQNHSFHPKRNVDALNSTNKIDESNITSNSRNNLSKEQVAVTIEDSKGNRQIASMNRNDVYQIEKQMNEGKDVFEKLKFANDYARNKVKNFPAESRNGDTEGGFVGLPKSYVADSHNKLSTYSGVGKVMDYLNANKAFGNVRLDPKLAKEQGVSDLLVKRNNEVFDRQIQKDMTQQKSNVKSTINKSYSLSIKNQKPQIHQSDNSYALSIKDKMGNTSFIPLDNIKSIDNDKIIYGNNNSLSIEDKNKIIEFINKNFNGSIPMYQMGGRLNRLSVNIPELNLNHVSYPKDEVDSYQGKLNGYVDGLAKIFTYNNTDFTDKDELGLPKDMQLYQLNSPYLSRTKANPSKPIAPFNHVQDPVNYTERGRTGIARLFNEMYPLLDAGRSNYFNKKIADKSKGSYNYTEDSPILKTSQSISSFPQMQIAHDKAAKLYRHANSIQSSDYDALNSSRNSLYNEGDNALMIGDLQAAETFAKNVAQAHQNAEDNRMINYQTHMSNAQKRDVLHNTFNEIDQRVYNQRAANNQAAFNQFLTNRERNRLEDVAVNKEILDFLSSQHNANNNNIYEFNKKYYINEFRKANPEFANRNDDDVVQAILGNIEYVPAKGFDANKFRRDFINNIGLNVDPKSEIDEKLYNFALSHSGNSYRYNDATRRMLKMLNESRMNLLDLKLKDNNNG